MKELAHHIGRLIRSSITGLSNRIPPWTAWDANEWNTPIHRRDRWE